jgi:hypothetical protein
MERAREEARAEYARNQHHMMLQSIDQSHPVHSLMSYPSISRPISGTQPSPREIWNMLNQQLDTLADTRRITPPLSSAPSTASLQRNLTAALQPPQRGDELEITYNTPQGRTSSIVTLQEQAMRDYYGMPPPILGVGSHTGTIRPRGLLFDGVNVPVPGSPFMGSPITVHSTPSPISVYGSSPSGSPAISVKSGSHASSVKSGSPTISVVSSSIPPLPPPPPQGSSTLGRGTIAGTVEP